MKKWGKMKVKLPGLNWFDYAFEKYLNTLFFTAEQLTILRTLGEYQGKQELY